MARSEKHRTPTSALQSVVLPRGPRVRLAGFTARLVYRTVPAGYRSQQEQEVGEAAVPLMGRPAVLQPAAASEGQLLLQPV